MSHIAVVELHVRDLAALAAACTALGLEFVEGQQQYHWFGRKMGDTAIPDGFTEADLGKCEHAIRIPGLPKAYEIGVVRRRDGKPGYLLQWDNWCRGFGMADVVGMDCGKLKQQYAAQVAAKQARSQGFRVTQVIGTDGNIRLTCTR